MLQTMACAHPLPRPCHAAKLHGGLGPPQRTHRRHVVISLAQQPARKQGPRAPLQPPLAPRVPSQTVLHGDTRIDEFAWLRNPSRRQPEVMGYLLAENEFSKAAMRRLAPLTQQLQSDLEDRLWQSAMAQAVLAPADEREDDASSGCSGSGVTGGSAAAGSAQVHKMHVQRPSTWLGDAPGAGPEAQEGHTFGHFVYVRQQLRSSSGASSGTSSNTDATRPFFVHMRAAPPGGATPALPHPQAAVLLDEAVRSGGSQGYVLHSFEPSPSFSHFAFTECTTSDPAAGTKHLVYTLYVHDALTHQPLVAAVEGVQGPIAWSPCGRHLHFTADGGYSLNTLHLPLPEPAAIEAHGSARSVGQWRPPPQPVISNIMHQTQHFPLQFRRMRVGHGGPQPPHQQLLLAEAVDSNLQARQLLALVPDAGSSRSAPANVHNQQYVWQEVVQSSLGARFLYLPVEGVSGGPQGLLIWTFSCAHPNGQLLWWPLASGGPAHAAQTQVLLHHRPDWSIWDLQVSKDHVLVSLVHAPHSRPVWAGPSTTSNTTDDDSVVEAAAAAARAWQQRDEEAGGGRCAPLQMCFEVHQLVPDASSSSSNFERTAGPVSGADGTGGVQLQLLEAVERSAGSLPFAEVQPPTWLKQRCALQLQASRRAACSFIRFAYSSLGQPLSTATLQLQPVRSHPADTAASGSISDHDGRDSEPSCGNIVHTRMWACSADGTHVPISIAYDPTQVQQGTAHAPVMLQVYGAYGKHDALGYAPPRATLLARGVVVAVAHVRGGGQLGPVWHEAGRGLRKHKGVEDVVACARALASSGLVHPCRICLVAGSAGGWVAGAALNAQPQLFTAAVLTVPSLDILSTMALEDDSRHELGDVRADPHAYTGVRVWAPFDNLPGAASLLAAWVEGVKRHSSQQQQPQPRPSVKLFPAVLVRTGLSDTVVHFWEPAKWVARLRWQLAAANALLQQSMQRDMRAAPEVLLQVRPGGHTCFDNTQDDAVMCSFILHHLGCS